jgi:hypothetical protein
MVVESRDGRFFARLIGAPVVCEATEIGMSADELGRPVVIIRLSDASRDLIRSQLRFDRAILVVDEELYRAETIESTGSLLVVGFDERDVGRFIRAARAQTQ